MRITYAALIGVLAIALLTFAETKGVFQPKPHNGKLVVSASFYPLYYFSSEIADGAAEVYNLTPAGAEPHDYELTTLDRARIEDSKLLVLNGVGLEAWGKQIKDTLANGPEKIIEVGESLASQENSGQGRDPHVWLDPILAENEVSQITTALMEIDPQNSGLYLQRKNELDKKFEKLDGDFKSGLSNCRLKDIVTTHAAFGYLANRYHFNQVSIAGLSPDAEPSAETLAKITDFAKAKGVKYIFFEKLVSPKFANAIAGEAGIQVLPLDPLEGLTQEEIASGKNYFTEMENNLANLKIALQCQ